MIDISAPIIPYVGMGGIKLYSTREELKYILNAPNVTSTIILDNRIRYDIGNSIMLFFHLSNNKLYKITTQENYLGKLPNGISTSTIEKDLIQYDSQITYDDDDEIWESPYGYWIETVGYRLKAAWISVYIREILDYDEFEKCNW